MGRHVAQMRAPQGTAAHLHPRFHVIATVTNSRRWRARYALFNDFAKHMGDQGAQLTVIECAFGDRAFAITDAGDPRHIQVRARHETWLKENLVNVAVSRLPEEAEYIAWVDADVHFLRPDIVNATIQALQHYAVVQMFSEAWDVSPSYETVAKHESFCRSYQMKRPRRPVHGSYGVPEPRLGFNTWHSGFAWACRRSAFDALGGLIDFAALGSADMHMAASLVGRGLTTVHPGAHPNYVKAVKRWQDRAEKHVRRNVGCVEGTLVHHHHGPKSRRLYKDRWKILVDHRFDPERDLKRNAQGVWQLHDDGTARHRHLRDGIRNYLAQRNEDDLCL